MAKTMIFGLFTSTYTDIIMSQELANLYIWIDSMAFRTNFIMQMRPSGSAGRAYQAYYVPPLHALACNDIDLGHVAVAGF